jgi:hypothetical protein
MLEFTLQRVLPDCGFLRCTTEKAQEAAKRGSTLKREL